MSHKPSDATSAYRQSDFSAWAQSIDETNSGRYASATSRRCLPA